jgi:hypothetical protein
MNEQKMRITGKPHTRRKGKVGFRVVAMVRFNYPREALEERDV